MAIIADVIPAFWPETGDERWRKPGRTIKRLWTYVVCEAGS